MYGDLVPVEGALVVASSDSFTGSSNTGADGSFQLSVPPGTYNVTASASPPASNINPSIIEGYVRQSAQDMIPVAGANVTAEPHCSGEDFGDSVTTDSNGFFNLTVRRFTSLEPSSQTIVLPDVPERVVGSVDFMLLVSGILPQCSEPSIFSLTVTDPSYATTVQTLSVESGSVVHLGDIFLATAPPSSITVSFQGADHAAVVNANAASTTNLYFDADRRLLNFTLSGTDGTIGSFVVVMPKSLLDGAPVVLVDNAPVASTFTENETHYFIRFDYALSTHAVAVGGSNTIPEFPFPSVSLVLAVSTLATMLLRRRREDEEKKRTFSAYRSS
jgi:hypothetical protein